MATFGDFSALCKTASFPFCKAFPVIQACYVGKSASAYADSNIQDDLGSLIASFLAFLGTTIIIYRTWSKHAAVGRVEMNLMNIVYILILACNIILVISTRKKIELNTPGNAKAYAAYLSAMSPIYSMSATYAGLVVGFFWILFLNGFVGYQVVEDGSKISIGGIVLSTALISLMAGLFTNGVGNGTSGSFGGPARTNSPALYGILLVWPIISVTLYCILMTYLVFKQLSQRKPIIYLLIAVVLFVLSVIFYMTVSNSLCLASGNALNGSPFGIILSFIAYVMLFKFWFAITEGI
eukprot:NODE_409_length_9212_cov_0.585537.p3 type:complete len:295 gc:universal NODE_409_length_9212_cov_0.585537:8590-7706(-)